MFGSIVAGTLLATGAHRPSGDAQPEIKTRIDRLHELAQGLAAEVTAQRLADGLLQDRERLQYLDGLQDARGYPG